MRHVLLIALLATPATAQTSVGTDALAGLQSAAQEICNHSAPTADPEGLAPALEGELGEAMGLRDLENIIGMVFHGDPRSGARMWASTLSGEPGGCDALIEMLSRPAAETIAALD